MTSSEDQIAADEDASSGPKRNAIVVIGADPDLADGTMGPNMEAVIERTFEDFLHRIANFGFELPKDICVLGFVCVFGLVFLGDRRFSARETSWFVALGNLKTVFVQTFLDFYGFETTLCFAGMTRFHFVTTIAFETVAFAVIGTVFGVLVRFGCRIRTRLGCVVRFRNGCLRCCHWFHSCRNSQMDCLQNESCKGKEIL